MIDAVTILERYLTGQTQRQETRRDFDELYQALPVKDKTKMRYAYGTFIRFTMYMAGTASAFEFLIKLRDLILYDRQVLCGTKVAEMIREQGAELGLYCDASGYANVVPSYPSWISNQEFIRNTYALTECRDADEYIIGDELLRGAVKKFHVYKSFEIKAAVHAALTLPEGYTYLASLPTGAGKSLITQMVAYYTEGLTIVVVPTVALAIDQYSAATSTLQDSFGEHIFYYRGSQSEQEYADIMAAINRKKARLLFISPEALLRNVALNRCLNKCAESGYLKNIVIDEAHIVPDWGILFRPDFQILSFALKRWREKSGHRLKTYLLSATLSDDTVDVLKDLYAPDKKLIEYRCDALRKEPQFCFYETKSIYKRWDAVEEAITLLPKPMIVYFLEPDEVLFFQKRMQDKGFLNIQAFHGDTGDEQRKAILDDWKNEKIDVILATSAFGIGVDKANVRTVVHACVPENLSRFYQEVGRAGRDGKASLSVLLPHTGKGNNGSDTEKAYSLVRGRVLRVETMISRWKGIMATALSDGDTFDVDTAAVPPHFTEEAREYAGERNSVWNINLLLFLHRTGFIEILDADYRIDAHSYHMKIKVRKVIELADDELMAQALDPLRAEEFDIQMDGYNRMKNLVQNPERRCWGVNFHRLYPLTSDCCNGCPKHPRNTHLVDDPYRIRQLIEYQQSTKEPSGALRFAMGHYDSLLVRNPHFPQIDTQSLSQIVSWMNDAGIPTLVGPEDIVADLTFSGLVLTTDEFTFMAEMYPGFFAGGVFAVFDDRSYNNSVLFDRICQIRELGYRTVLYCSDDMYIQGHNRRITDFFNCKIRNASDLI